MGGLCVKHVTCTHMTVLQLAAFSEFRHDRSASLQSHSHVHSISESLDIYLFVHTAQPVLDVATFQRFSEWRRHKDAIFSQAMDGLSQGRLLHAVDLLLPPPPKHWWALLLLRTTSGLFFTLWYFYFWSQMLRVPHWWGMLQRLCCSFHMRLIRIPCFPMRTKFRASYVHMCSHQQLLLGRILMNQNCSVCVKRA